MNRQHLHSILEAIAQQHMAGHETDYWPAIFNRIQSSQRHHHIQRWTIAVCASILLVLTMLFVPPVRATIDSLIKRISGAFISEGVLRNSSVARIPDISESQPMPTPVSIADLQAYMPFRLHLPAAMPQYLTLAYAQPYQEKGINQIRITYRHIDDTTLPLSRLLELVISSGEILSPPLLAQERQETVTVAGQPAIFIKGGWRPPAGQENADDVTGLVWDNTDNDMFLFWQQEGLTFLLSSYNLPLTQADLLAIAGSVQPVDAR